MKRRLKTWLYLRPASCINMLLRPFGLVLMAEFEGDPPARPYLVERMFIARRGAMGLWP